MDIYRALSRTTIVFYARSYSPFSGGYRHVPYIIQNIDTQPFGPAPLCFWEKLLQLTAPPVIMVANDMRKVQLREECKSHGCWILIRL